MSPSSRKHWTSSTRTSTTAPCSTTCASAVLPCPPTTSGREWGQRRPLSPRSPMTVRFSVWPSDGASTSLRPTSCTPRSSETGSNSNCSAEASTSKRPRQSNDPKGRLVPVLELGGVDGGFSAVVHLELAQQPRNPILDRVLTEHEDGRRFLVGLAVRDHLQEPRLLS